MYVWGCAAVPMNSEPRGCSGPSSRVDDPTTPAEPPIETLWTQEGGRWKTMAPSPAATNSTSREAVISQAHSCRAQRADKATQARPIREEESDARYRVVKAATWWVKLGGVVRMPRARNALRGSGEPLWGRWLTP